MSADRRQRLAAIERELARLQAEHELAMARFLFDEANEMQRRIAPLEQERRRLAATMPDPAPAPTGIVPELLRRPRRPRR
jgi:hypothetical protein